VKRDARRSTSSSLPTGPIQSLAAVLSELRKAGSCTRSELGERTALSRAVVSQRVTELVARGLIEEGEQGESSGGRAPRLLRFRAEAGSLLVADVGATAAAVAITDLGGNILDFLREPIEVAQGPDVVLGRVRELFDQLRERADDASYAPLWGIGIGVPGPVEFSTGRPVSPPIMPGWDQFPIRTYFADYKVPIWVDNDANLMALGEVTAGIARGHEALIYVKIGTGIGAGLIVKGRLHRGAEGCAGDVGHIQITDDPTVICRCGNVGCLEALAGGAAIARMAEAAAREGTSAILASAMADKGYLTAADVGWAATHGDQTSVEMVGRAGRLVGGMLATLVNIMNPSLIVIGGGVSLVGDLLLASIRQSVYGRSLPLATRSLTIQRSSLGPRGGVTGAAALVADQLFSPSLLGAWLAQGQPVGRPELAAAAVG
jgi:glucokinase-like ROK family protein